MFIDFSGHCAKRGGLSINLLLSHIMFKPLHTKLLASAAGLMAVPATYAQSLKGFGDAAPLHDHDGNTVVTVDGGEDAVLLSFPQPFTISGYAVATPGDIDAVKVQISTDGNTWSDLSVNAGKSYSEGDVHTRVLNLRHIACITLPVSVSLRAWSTARPPLNLPQACM